MSIYCSVTPTYPRAVLGKTTSDTSSGTTPTTVVSSSYASSSMNVDEDCKSCKSMMGQSEDCAVSSLGSADDSCFSSSVRTIPIRKLSCPKVFYRGGHHDPSRTPSVPESSSWSSSSSSLLYPHIVNPNVHGLTTTNTNPIPTTCHVNNVMSSSSSHSSSGTGGPIKAATTTATTTTAVTTYPNSCSTTMLTAAPMMTTVAPSSSFGSHVSVSSTSRCASCQRKAARLKDQAKEIEQLKTLVNQLVGLLGNTLVATSPPATATDVVGDGTVLETAGMKKSKSREGSNSVSENMTPVDEEIHYVSDHESDDKHHDDSPMTLQAPRTPPTVPSLLTSRSLHSPFVPSPLKTSPRTTTTSTSITTTSPTKRSSSHSPIRNRPPGLLSLVSREDHHRDTLVAPVSPNETTMLRLCHLKTLKEEAASKMMMMMTTTTSAPTSTLTASSNTHTSTGSSTTAADTTTATTTSKNAAAAPATTGKRHIHVCVRGEWGYYSGPTLEQNKKLRGCVVRFDNGDLYLGEMLLYVPKTNVFTDEHGLQFHGRGTLYRKGGETTRGLFHKHEIQE